MCVSTPFKSYYFLLGDVHIPLSYSYERITLYSDKLHDFSVIILRCHEVVCVNISFPLIVRIKNALTSKIFFYQGFLCQTLMIHRTAGEGRSYIFNSSLPLLPASQTFRHLLGKYCRENLPLHIVNSQNQTRNLDFQAQVSNHYAMCPEFLNLGNLLNANKQVMNYVIYLTLSMTISEHFNDCGIAQLERTSSQKRCLIHIRLVLTM